MVVAGEVPKSRDIAIERKAVSFPDLFRKERDYMYTCIHVHYIDLFRLLSMVVLHS